VAPAGSNSVAVQCYYSVLTIFCGLPTGKMSEPHHCVVSLDSVNFFIDSLFVTSWCGTEIQNGAETTNESIELGLVFLISVRDIMLCDLRKLATVLGCQLTCPLKLIAAKTLPQHVSAYHCSATFSLFYKNYVL
jgi:hypothetical protein